jgi:hypothetical protein
MKAYVLLKIIALCIKGSTKKQGLKIQLGTDRDVKFIRLRTGLYGRLIYQQCLEDIRRKMTKNSG